MIFTTPPALRANALISPDGRHRLTLFRCWNPHRGVFLVIGCNPSTADAREDDPTIRRCMAFARREGCGTLHMLNLWTFRATDPKDLPADRMERNHPEADDWIVSSLAMTRIPGSRIVAAWGAIAADATDRIDEVIALCRLGDLPLPPVLCFGTTKGGHPRHPLYLASNAPLVPFPA